MDQEYEVEKILTKRYWNGKAQYRLKWNGYPSTHNSWQYEENMNCAELLETFERTQNVGKILSTRMLNGVRMYLIQRIYEDDAIEMTANEAYINCINLVLRFLENAMIWSAPTNRSDDFTLIDEMVFVPDTEPVRITYASKVNRNLMYWVEWPAGGKFIPSKDAKARWPMLVVAFLESRVLF